VNTSINPSNLGDEVERPHLIYHHSKREMYWLHVPRIETPLFRIWSTLSRKFTLGYVRPSLSASIASAVTRHTYYVTCYDMEVGENRVHVFYGTEKREGKEKTRDIWSRHQPLQQSPCIRSVTYLRHKYTCNITLERRLTSCFTC
jgi:hypothetical protein